MDEYDLPMESEMEMKESSRTRLASSGCDSNNSIGACELTSMEVESDATSTASLQQQQRKLWRSKSTVRSSELSVEAANSAVTSEELKELKQWFQVIKYKVGRPWNETS